MAINFPASPVLGQTIVVGNKVYAWNGTGWAIPTTATGGGGGGGGASVTTDDIAPQSAKDGDMWLKTSTGVLYVYYDDGNSKQWIQVSASPQIVDQSYTRKTAKPNNCVTNPSMLVSQENGQVSGSANGFYPADQWVLGVLGVSMTTFWTQNMPSLDDNSWQVSIGSTANKPSLAAGDYAHLMQSLEGVNFNALVQWGNSDSARAAVLRFNFYAIMPGLYSVSITNAAGDRSFVAQFNIPTAYKPTLVVVPIPPCLDGTWPKTNAVGSNLRFCYAVGATYVTPTPGVWVTGNYLAGPGQVNPAATSSSFYVTDVGLYPDPQRTGLAPPFEIEDYGAAVIKCKRYWQQVYSMWSGYSNGGGAASHATWNAPVQPRTSPTLTGTTIGQSIFPAAVGPLTNQGPLGGGYEYRQTNTVSMGYFQSTITLNARM